MNSRIHSMKCIKSNIVKNKSAKIFAKTVTSNFLKKTENSPKINKEFIMTKSTRFSDNNLTNTLASSIRSISKFRLKKNKNKKKLFIDLDNFYNEFLLNKIMHNTIIKNIYKKNGINKYKTNYLPHNYSTKINSIKLKKKSASPSIYTSSTTAMSRNMFINYNYNKKGNNNPYQVNSHLSLFLDKFQNDEKNNDIVSNLKDISKISKKKNNDNTNSFINNINNEFLQNNLFNNISLYNHKYKKYKSIFKSHKSKINLKQNILKIGNINSDIFKPNNSISDENTKNKTIKNNQEEKNSILICRNKISLMEKLAYPSFNSFLLSRPKRVENTQQFINKTKLLILDNYFKKINKDRYEQYFSINDSNNNKLKLRERNIQVSTNLLNIYSKSLDKYVRFLVKKYRDMQDENDDLRREKRRINSDIKIIKQKILKGMTTIREAYDIKFFLMCVKNHTLFFEKFPKEDIEELEHDKLKLKESYYTINPETLKKKRKVSRKDSNRKLSLMNQFKRMHSITSIKRMNSKKSVLLNEESSKKVTQKKFFSKKNFKETAGLIFTINDFFDHLEAISTKVYNLIKESSDKYVNNNYYKLELINVLKQTTEDNKNSIILENKIKEYELNLKNLKTKNKKLLEILNQQKDNKFITDSKTLLILMNIHKIYDNIKKENEDIKNIRKENMSVLGEQLKYLKIIEDFYVKLKDKVAEDKNEYPDEYDKIKMQLEKNKKHNAFICFQRLLVQKLQIKIDNVLKKAKKIIYIKNRKTNDYTGYYKPLPKKKSVEKEKNDMEIFFEYIDNNND